MFGRFRTARPQEGIGSRLYGAIVTASRSKALYRELGVPDTIDGRFDMLLLHAALVIERLDRDGPQAKEITQALFDKFCADMDRSLREMGVGDLSIPRRMRAMAEGFYGRLAAYAPALRQQDLNELSLGIGRNVFPHNPEPSLAAPLAAYTLASVKALEKCSSKELRDGSPIFAEPRQFAPSSEVS